MLRWLLRRREHTASDDSDPELERIRVERARTERLVSDLQRWSDQLELALDRKDGRRNGRT